uniref:Phosphoprotein n=1 Tax=Nyavirus nyamaniniense TaxID=644610 RepID=A0A9E8DAX6_9MONO|nr:putative phosphoprotein [Nyavirus nyamaniniense]
MEDRNSNPPGDEGKKAELEEAEGGYLVTRHRDQCAKEEEESQQTDSAEEEGTEGEEEEEEAWEVEAYLQEADSDLEGKRAEDKRSNDSSEEDAWESQDSREDARKRGEESATGGEDTEAAGQAEDANLDKRMQARFVQWQSNTIRLLRSEKQEDKEEGSRAIALTYRRRREQGEAEFYKWRSLLILESELARAAPRVLTLGGPPTPEASKWDAVLDELQGLQIED